MMMPQSQAIENGTIDVENDVAALQAALVRDLGTHWGIRGNKEMQKLHWMYFSFGTVQSSPLQSLPCVTFDQGMGDKMRKLNFKNPYMRAGE
jgi:hypothetical protein